MVNSLFCGLSNNLFDCGNAIKKLFLFSNLQDVYIKLFIITLTILMNNASTGEISFKTPPIVRAILFNRLN